MVRKYRNNQEKLEAMRQAIALRQRWLQAIRKGATKEHRFKSLQLGTALLNFMLKTANILSVLSRDSSLKMTLPYSISAISWMEDSPQEIGYSQCGSILTKAGLTTPYHGFHSGLKILITMLLC